MRFIKTLLAGLIAATAFGLAVDSAHADPGDVITISGGSGITARGKLTFTTPLVTMSCEVTVNGSVRSGPITQTGTIESIGAITAATFTSCLPGSATPLVNIVTRAWNILKVLPLPNSGLNIRLWDTGIDLTLAPVTCRYGGVMGTTAGDIRWQGGAIIFTRAAVPRISGTSILCGGGMAVGGRLEATPITATLA